MKNGKIILTLAMICIMIWLPDARADVTIESQVNGTAVINGQSKVITGGSTEVGVGLFGPSALSGEIFFNGTSVNATEWLPIEFLVHTTGYVFDPIVLPTTDAWLKAKITIAGEGVASGFYGVVYDSCYLITSSGFGYSGTYGHDVVCTLHVDNGVPVTPPYQKTDLHFHLEGDGTGYGSATITATYQGAEIGATIAYEIEYNTAVFIDYPTPADFTGYARMISASGAKGAISGEILRFQGNRSYIPSFTTIGLSILILLLIASAIWVIYKKPAAA